MLLCAHRTFDRRKGQALALKFSFIIPAHQARLGSRPIRALGQHAATTYRTWRASAQLAR
jgi:hypothetical protein